MALNILFIGKGNARNSPDKAGLSASHSSSCNNSLTANCAQNPSLATSLMIDGIQCNEAEKTYVKNVQSNRNYELTIKAFLSKFDVISF
jgi:hypothetical protein